MNILITDRHESELSITLGMICEGKEAVVSPYKPGARLQGLQVLCVNAAHKCWRGGGRYFASVADALAGYRSPEMRAMIQHAADVAEGRAS